MPCVVSETGTLFHSCVRNFQDYSVETEYYGLGDFSAVSDLETLISPWIMGMGKWEEKKAYRGRHSATIWPFSASPKVRKMIPKHCLTGKDKGRGGGLLVVLYLRVRVV
jgi:hypothetical protein